MPSAVHGGLGASNVRCAIQPHTPVFSDLVQELYTTLSARCLLAGTPLSSLTNAPVVLLGSEETVHENDGSLLRTRRYVFGSMEVVS